MSEEKTKPKPSEEKTKPKPSMHHHCSVCGALVTHAIGDCDSCIEDDYAWQEPPDYDEMVEYE